MYGPMVAYLLCCCPRRVCPALRLEKEVQIDEKTKSKVRRTLRRNKFSLYGQSSHHT